MNACRYRFLFRLGIPVCAFSAGVLLPLAFSFDSTLAQELKPVADGTLGVESSIVTPTSPQADRIDGGAIRGVNLFHSFSQFNIGEGREAYFANPSGIENILSRVTGGDASRIFGKLGVLGNANLFLINPNGIIFGRNASLDVRGSFVGTTANAIGFGDRGFFSATVPNTPELLTINPSALFFNQIAAAPIQSNSGNLTVGQNLTLVAGNLDLQGQLKAGENLTLQAVDTVRLTDSAENPLIAKAGNHLVVQGNQAVDIFALNHPASGLFSSGDMVLRSANTVGGDAHYTTGGNFRIEQLDGQLGSLFSSYDPIIRASGDLRFNSYRGASLHILAGGSVSIPGNVTITGADTLANSIIENITLSDGTSVVSINGNAQPTLDIRAGTTAFGTPGIVGSTAGFSSATPTTNSNGTTANIAIGSITNRGGVVFLTNQYNPNTSLSDGAIQVGAIDISTSNFLFSSDAGSVTIDSRESITLSNTLLATSNNFLSTGNGGTVTLKAQNDITTASISSGALGFFSAANGGNISLSSTVGAINTTAGILNSNSENGNGGDITLNANGNITTADILSNFVGTLGSGNGGNISLTSAAGAINTSAGSLRATTSNFRSGNGGTVTLKSQNDITTGNIYTVVGFGGIGNGGNISLTSTEGAINTSAGKLDTGVTFGNGGAITLNARNNITTAELRTNKVDRNAGVGNGGDISLTSAQGAIDTKAGILDSFSANGNAGNITLKALNDITTNNISTLVEYRGVGNGGNISLTSTEGAINTSAGKLDTGVTFGNGGAITLNARNNITTAELRTNKVDRNAGVGNGGDISLTSAQGAIDTKAGTLYSYSDNGNGGNITLNANGNITAGSITSYTLGSGKGGNINIDAESLSIPKGAQLTASTFGKGDAGNVNINVRDIVSFNESYAFTTVETGAEGNGGDINITAKSLFVTNGSQLLSRILGQGNAGSVNIIARDRVSFNGGAAISTVESGAKGNGNVISIKAESLSLSNGAQLNVRAGGDGSIAINVQDLNITAGSGLVAGINSDLGTTDSQAGNIEINATGTISLSDKSFINNDLLPQAKGNGGNINITTGSLFVTGGSQLSTSNLIGQGNAGNINIIARDIVSFEGIAFPTETVIGTELTPIGGEGSRGPFRFNSVAISRVAEGIGDGGNINITTGSLFVTNGAGLVASTQGQGNAGRITINARDLVSFAGEDPYGLSSNAASRVEITGEGKGGGIDITASQLSVTQGALLTVSTDGRGDAGNVTINARDRISFDGVGRDGVPTGAYSRVLRDAEGQGGSIIVNVPAGSLSVTNGAQLSASTLDRRDGGNIIISANTLEAINGGQILTTSLSGGKAGNITVNTTDSIKLSGSDPNYFNRVLDAENDFSGAGSVSGLFANTAPTSTGQGGDLRITTGQLIVRDGAEVTVSSEGTGNAGSLIVEANSIKLDNQGKLQATTASGEGGNINLQVRDLILMRYQSLISAEARNNGNGGNITINTPFIIAVPGENSDIIANAFQGRGGNINITTQGIYGLEERERLTSRSDINASSEFGIDGSIQLNTPEIDLNSGLINLPSVPVDTQVAQGCNSPNYAQSSFIVTGRGGLPPNPKDALTPDAVEVDWVTLNPELDKNSRTNISTNPNPTTPAPIVEATGWVFGPKGEVIFTAQLPTQHQSFWQTSLKCYEK